MKELFESQEKILSEMSEKMGRAKANITMSIAYIREFESLEHIKEDVPRLLQEAYDTLSIGSKINENDSETSD